MDVHVLEYLIFIEQEKSISKAAERANVSQSAISQCLAKVEQELDNPLFIRVNRQMVPTRIGSIYLNGAKEMLDVKKDVYQKIQDLEKQSETRRKIAIDIQVYQTMMKKILPELQTEFPETKFEILLVDSHLNKQYLLNGIADAGILCIKENSNSMLSFFPLYHERLVLTVPKNHIAKYGNELSSLYSAPFIVPQNGSYFEPVFDSVLSQSHAAPVTHYVADDFNSMKQLMEQGYGLTLLPERMTEPSDTYEIIPSPVPYEYQLFFCTPKYASSAPELKKLCELTQKYTAQQLI